MKKYIILIVGLLYSVSYAMQSSWQELTQGFAKSNNVQDVINENYFSLPLVTMYSRFDNSDFFLLLLYSDQDNDKNYYEDIGDDTYKSFQNLAQRLSRKTGDAYVVSCKYCNKNQKEVAESFAKLLNCLKNGVIVLYAFGKSAHIVNMATHFYEQNFAKNKANKCIDLILYAQSPIYEYSWSILEQKYNYNKEWSPTCFKALYNFYTKANLPTYNMIQYPDRKYRRPAVNELGVKPIQIKNIRMLQKNGKKQLVDMSTQEIKNFILIDTIPALLRESEKYKINFDLIAQRSESGYPIVAINRLVQIYKHVLLHTYGDKKDQLYQISSSSNIEEIKEDIIRERNMSRFALSQIGKDTILKDIADRHEQDIMLEDNIYTKY